MESAVCLTVVGENLVHVTGHVKSYQTFKENKAAVTAKEYAALTGCRLDISLS